MKNQMKDHTNKNNLIEDAVDEAFIDFKMGELVTNMDIMVQNLTSMAECIEEIKQTQEKLRRKN